MRAARSFSGGMPIRLRRRPVGDRAGAGRTSVKVLPIGESAFVRFHRLVR